MDDQKANAAYHPGTGPTTAVDPELQAEAEAGETQHDVDVAAQNQAIIDELRELVGWEAMKADARRVLAVPDHQVPALAGQVTAERFNRIRAVLGVPVPTAGDMLALADQISAEGQVGS